MTGTRWAVVSVASVLALAGCAGSSQSIATATSPAVSTAPPVASVSNVPTNRGHAPKRTARIYLAALAGCHKDLNGATFSPLIVTAPHYQKVVGPTQGCRNNRLSGSYVYDIPIPASGSVTIQPGNEEATTVSADQLNASRVATVFYAYDKNDRFARTVIEYHRDKDLNRALSLSSTPPPGSDESEPKPVEPRPIDRLTGIGATRSAFAANHTADPDPRLASGCCFGPKVHNSGASSGQDQYAPVQYGGGYVIIETINYDTGTPRSEAIRLVRAELPHDARLVKTRRANVCLALLYKSHDLQSNTKGLGSYVTVSLYGRFDGPYDPDDVEEAILAPTGNYIGRC